MDETRQLAADNVAHDITTYIPVIRPPFTPHKPDRYFISNARTRKPVNEGFGKGECPELLILSIWHRYLSRHVDGEIPEVSSVLVPSVALRRKTCVAATRASTAPIGSGGACWIAGT